MNICYLLDSQHPFIPLLTLYLPSALGEQTPLIPSCPHLFLHQLKQVSPIGFLFVARLPF